VKHRNKNPLRFEFHLQERRALVIAICKMVQKLFSECFILVNELKILKISCEGDGDGDGDVAFMRFS
jgi:hypothetical protein